MLALTAIKGLKTAGFQTSFLLDAGALPAMHLHLKAPTLALHTSKTLPTISERQHALLVRVTKPSTRQTITYVDLTWHRSKK